MRNPSRPISGLLLAVLLVMGAAFAAAAAPHRGPAPSPSPSGSPAPLPTATPEPPNIAIPRLEAKLKADPNDRDAAIQLCSYYLQLGRPDLSLPLTQHLLATGTKTAQVYFFDGSANRGLGRIKEATDDLEQASNLEPTNAQVLLTLTDLYLQTNRASDAERVAKRATTFNPTDQHAFINYGLVLAQQKKYDDARAALETAAKLDPKDATPIVLEAKSYVDQNAIVLAQQTYDRALTVDPKSIDALLGKARLFVAQHQVKDAAATYEAILPLLPDDDSRAALIAEEAKAYAGEKMNTDAEALYKRDIATYPKSAIGHVAYGDYYAANNQLQQAESEWMQALGPSRDNREALLRLGEFYLHKNDAQRGIDMFKRLVELSPTDPSALGLLGQAYSFAHQFDRAHETYRKSFEIGRTPQALAGLAAADYELKNYREGAQAFDALEKGAGEFLRQNPQLYFVMGKCYAATNQKQKAKDAYARFLAFIKPGSQAATDVKKLIAELDKPAPKPTSSPKH